MPDIIPETSFIGLDIGTRWIKAVEIKKGKGGYHISKIARKEIIDIKSDNPEQSNQACIATINALLKENNFSNRKIVSGLPGHQVFFRKMILPATTDTQLSKIIFYEARQQIPFPLDKIQLDYHIKPIPDSSEVEVLLIGSKREIITEHMKFIRSAGIGIKYEDVTPLALFNFHKYIDPDIANETIALINIGAATTDISIVNVGWISFCRTAPVGGNDLTRNIAKALNIDFTQAEQIKLQQGRIPLEYEISLGIDESGDSGDDIKIRQALTTGLDRLVGEIRRTFDYFISQPDGVAINRVILSGGTSLLPNIEGYISEKLAIPVSLIQQQENFQQMPELADQYRNELPWITTAVGLALRSVPKASNLIRVDFLPPEMKNIRDFKEKRLQIAIASVLLLLIIYIGSLFGSDEIIYKQQLATDLLTRASRADTGYRTYTELMSRKDNITEAYEDLFLVIGKRGYWLRILSELNRITPVDIWLTRLQCTADFKLIIDGRSLSDGAIADFAKALGESRYVEKDEQQNALVKPVFISTPAIDPRLDRTVTTFTFEVTLRPPRVARPQEAS